jgi:hypothetical protein
MPLFVRQSARTVLTHVGVGMGAASFWRGAWYVLDDHLFPDDREKSAASSLLLGVAGMTLSQGLVHRCEDLARRKFARPYVVRAARFGALYTVAVSVVLVWRGTWIGWDCVYERLHPHNSSNGNSAEEAAGAGAGAGPGARHLSVRSTDPGHATHSGLLSHVTALALLLGTGLFASVLAPPAAVSVLRDWAVRTASPGSRAYQGPAQLVAQRLFGGAGASASAGATTSASAGPAGAMSGHHTASLAAGRALSTGTRSPSNLSAPPKAPSSLIRPS